MAIAFSCRCGATLRVPEVLAGEAGRCPGCDRRLLAPRPAPPPAAAAPQAEPVESPEQASLRDPFRVVRVGCSCGRRVAAPEVHLAAGEARCPSCDRVLSR